MVVFRSAARAAQGGGHEPAVDRRGLRRGRGRLPVGLGQEPHRRRQGRADRGVGADDAVRHRVRPVDGLRGLPALAHQGGVRPHRTTTPPPWPTAWPSTARVITAAAADHGVRVRSLRARRRPGHSSCSASAWRWPCSSTPRSSAWCSCRRRWSCSATATGGCRSGSTGSCRSIDVEGHAPADPHAAEPEKEPARAPVARRAPDRRAPVNDRAGALTAPRLRPVALAGHGQAPRHRRIAGEGQDHLQVPRRRRTTCAPRWATSPTCRSKGLAVDVDNGFKPDLRAHRPRQAGGEGPAVAAQGRQRAVPRDRRGPRGRGHLAGTCSSTSSRRCR